MSRICSIMAVVVTLLYPSVIVGQETTLGNPIVLDSVLQMLRTVHPEQIAIALEPSRCRTFDLDGETVNTLVAHGANDALISSLAQHPRCPVRSRPAPSPPPAPRVVTDVHEPQAAWDNRSTWFLSGEGQIARLGVKNGGDEAVPGFGVSIGHTEGTFDGSVVGKMSIGKTGSNSDSLRLQQILLRARWTGELAGAVKGSVGLTGGYNRLRSRFYDTSSSFPLAPIAIANGASLGAEYGLRFYSKGGAFDAALLGTFEGAVYDKTVTSVTSSDTTYTVSTESPLTSFVVGFSASITIRF
jgi:hypothetical protein